MDIDETDWVVMAHAIVKQGLPYVSVVEKKPILSYLLYTLVTPFGFVIWPMRILGVFWLFATCLFIGAAARRATGRTEAGLAATWLCGLISTCNALSMNAELMLNLPTAAALYFFVRAEIGERPRCDFWAGLCIGLATLFKHQAGILLIAFELAYLWQWARDRRGMQLPRHAALLGGFVLTWIIPTLIYLCLGHLADFYEWNVRRNLFYANSASAGSAGARFLLGALLYVAFAAPVAWTLAARASFRPRDPLPLQKGLALALWLTWIPVSLGGRFYPHYYLQFAPPLALLAAPHVSALLGRWTELRPAVRRWVAIGFILPLTSYFCYGLVRGLRGRYPCQEKRTQEVARWLRENTPTDARVFVWGHYSPILYLAQRLPGTRYINASVLIGDFDPHHLSPGFDLRPYTSRPDLEATLTALEKNRVPYIVDTAPADIHEWSKVPLSTLPALEAYVRENYEPIARPGGAVVYRRTLTRNSVGK